jgi:hypothetical protein
VSSAQSYAEARFLETPPWFELPVESDGLHPAKHEALFGHVRALEEEQLDVAFMNQLNARLYSNREPLRFQWNSTLLNSVRPLTPNEDNVVQAVTDTLVARVGSMKPKATVYTRGADFKVYRRGRNLDKYLWGQFQHLGIHRIGRRVFRDALVYGTGFLKLFVGANKEICAERVNPDEVIVDQRECVSDEYPLQIHHRRLMSRLALIKKFPKHKDAILEAQSEGFQYTSYRTPSDEQIVVIESWRMGVEHTIAIENATLFTESYKHDRAPFVVLRWSDALSGFYGRSVVSDLIGYQIRLNKLNQAIDSGQDVMCVPRVFVDQGSEVLSTQLDDQIGKIVKFRGTLPEAVTWTAFNAEIYNERERLWLRAHESQGVSQMSSSNKLPSQARLDSSEALREYNAQNDERFNDRVQSLEEWYLEVAQEIIRLSADLYSNQKTDTRTAWRSGNLVQQIDWSDCDMERDKYVLQISASSVLNMTPAARKDKLAFWLDRQLISPEQFKAWSGEPDLEALSQLEAATHDALMADIDAMLDGRTDKGPDPHMNLAYAISVVNGTYLHIKSLEAPERIQGIFRTWLLTAEALVNQPVPAPANANVPGGPAVPGDMNGAAPQYAGMPGPPGMGVPPMMQRPGEMSPPHMPVGAGVPQ